MIEVESVSVAYGEGSVPVLSEASLSVDRGEFLALVGPNGAGKTTLLRTVNGLLAPDAGRVLVDGDDVVALSARETSRRVATLPQETNLAFAFDVREVVAMGRTPYRSRFGRPDDGDVVDAAMERAGIDHLADRPVDAVSGGERQRVLLARALAQETPVVLLDEPTASLDVNHQVETLELVRTLVASGRTVVAAIHDLDLAARYCDRMALLADGAISAVGPPDEVLSPDALEAAFDVPVAVSEHPVTGTPTVTALGEGTPDALAPEPLDGADD